MTRRWRTSNPEAVRAWGRRWQKAHLEVARANKSLRRARKASLPHDFTSMQWQRALDYFGHRCAVCGRTADFWTVIAIGHWIAISDPCPDNPGTVATNIIPICHSRPAAPAGSPCCNNSMRNKNPLIWLNKVHSKRKAQQIAARIDAYFGWVRAQDSISSQS